MQTSFILKELRSKAKQLHQIGANLSPSKHPIQHQHGELFQHKPRWLSLYIYLMYHWCNTSCIHNCTLSQLIYSSIQYTLNYELSIMTLPHIHTTYTYTNSNRIYLHTVLIFISTHSTLTGYPLPPTDTGQGNHDRKARRCYSCHVPPLCCP